MKKLNNILWGIVLIAVGVIGALNAFNLTHIDIFFNGWWTLFIIVPCSIGLITDHDKVGNLIGLIIGILTLLCVRDILSFDMLLKLAIPVVVIIIGVKMIMGAVFGNKSAEIIKNMKENGKILRSGNAMFSSNYMNFNGEVFEGVELNAVFGGMKCDLTNAIIQRDCAINASAIFGGIDIIVPANVNVKVNSNSIFGGVNDKKHNNSKENAHTLYVNATCMFGGVEIK